MKKLIAALLMAALALTGMALADTYIDDVSFIYNEKALEFTADEKDDNGHLLVLTATDEAWGDSFIRIYLGENTGEAFPTVDDLKETLPDTEITQGEWLGYEGVLMYETATDNANESVFIVPLTDGRSLTVTISVAKIDDEDVAMKRSDLISEVVDTLNVAVEANGASAIYTIADLDAASAIILDEIKGWEGVELHSMDYVGDDCNSEENLAWLNSLKDGANFTQCIEFITDFHSPVEGGGAWEPDTEYSAYQWWLARAEGGEWQLVTMGY